MRRLLFATSLLLCTTIGYSQPKPLLDSLLTAGDELVRTNAYAAEPLLTRALQLADSLRQPLARAEALNSLGAVYTQQEEYVKSQQVLQQAEQLLKQLKADSLLLDTYSNLGILHERTQKWDEALRFYQQVEALLTSTKAPPIEHARNLTNTGHVLEEQGKLEEARQAYLAALRICNEHQIAFGQALLNQNLANLHNQLRQWDESLRYSATSLQIARAAQLPRIIAAAYQNMGATYLSRGQYQQALGLYQQALDSATAIGYNKVVLDASYQLSVCYEKTGQPAAALNMYKRHAALKDSVLSAEKLEKIEALQTAYSTRTKEAAIATLQQQQQLAAVKQQRTYLALAGLLVALVLTMLYMRQRLQRRQAQAEADKQAMAAKAAEEKQLLEHEKMLSELNALKAQMNPHFLFNALNSIQDLFMSGNSQLANEQLGKFSDLTRAILDASGRQTISLHEELDMLRNYLDLESLRFDDNFSYELTAMPGLDLYSTEIPPMLVQPYVENAIKHGLLHKTSNRRLQVVFLQEKPGLLKVSVTDNGVGRQQAAYYQQLRGKKHQSFGSSATEKRLELLNRGKAETISVQYTDLTAEDGSPAGTVVSLYIPVADHSS